MINIHNTKCGQEDDRIRRYNSVLEGINRIFSSIVNAETEEDLGNACLSVALEITGSEYGFVGELGADELLHDIAVSDMGWEQCLMHEKTGHRLRPGALVLHGLYGSVIDNAKSFFTNDPSSHPDSIGLPQGHPPLTSFLGVPLILDGKVKGIIAVANRKSGYSLEQQEDLEAIVPAMIQSLQRKREEQEHIRAEEALRESEELQAFLLKLSDALRAEPDADAVANRAIRMLSEQLRLDRCYIGVYRLADDRGDFTHQVGNDRVPPLPDGVRLSDFPEALRVAFDRTLVIDDVAETEGLTDTDRRNLGTLGLRALVAATLRKGENNPLWSIVSVSARPRHWTRGEIALAEEVTERTWMAMERARAEEALRLSEEKFRILSSTLEEKVKERTDELAKAYNLLEEIATIRKQEIHHRIKNNLQVISSLLDLQAEKFRGKKNIEDSQILEAFKESQDRIISMALIHEELHKGGKTDTLDFSSYLKELADNLLLTYNVENTNISLNTDVDKDIFFDLDIAVPLGMIVNELVSNSFKYAFSGRDKGEIKIKLYREESKSKDSNSDFVLTVSDNGVGIPENIDPENVDSLGLQLVTTLVEQLDGELELKINNGTEFTIRFSVIENNNRALGLQQLTDL